MSLVDIPQTTEMVRKGVELQMIFSTAKTFIWNFEVKKLNLALEVIAKLVMATVQLIRI